MALAALEQRAQRRVGTVLRGKYALERVLGAGGMGAVYLGVHRNGHRVAVKVLHPEASADPDTRARFLREGYVANSIGHPGAVRVLDDDVAEDGAAFLVMELLEGETLYVRAKRSGGRLPAREVLALAHALCDVLAAAHAKGVVHRDIKPENLFLTADRVLKVLDFGIARGGSAARVAAAPVTGAGGGAAEVADGATRAGAALGTPAFMPPEQALGHSRDVDARSDLYSVGATLFALLSGYIVHEAASQGELLLRAATCPARSLAAAAPDAPAPVVALIDRALAFAREERWPSARAMEAAIEEAYLAVFGEPLSTDAIGPVPAAPSTTRPSSPRARTEEASSTVADTQPAAPPLGLGYRETQPDTLLPFSARRPTTDAGATTTHPGARASAPTVPAGASDPPPPPAGAMFSTASGPSPSRARTRPSAAPPAPVERAGKALALGLALVAGVALLVARTRHAGVAGTPSLDGAGQAPCFHDDDCRAEGWVCGPGGRCVEGEGDGPASGTAPARSGCTSSRACVEASRGRPAICRTSDGACVPLEAEGCKVLAAPGDVGNDATVWVGAMFPLSGHAGTLYGKEEARMVDLARRDFAEVAGGLPPARPGGPKRPLGVVLCDDEEDPARVASHLADDVRVPAILGFALSREVTDLAESTFNPKGVLALASNTASVLRSIPRPPGQPRLVWRTSLSSDMEVPAVAAILSGAVEPEIRVTPGLLAPGEPLRVALVRVGNASGLAYADAYVSALRFNGKSVGENGESFRQVVLPEAKDDADVPAQLAHVAQEIGAFLPHVVISVFDPPYAPAVEAAWPRGARFRPRYLRVHLTQPEMRALVQAHPEARKRMLDIDTATSTPAVAKLVLRYNEVFPEKTNAVAVKGAPYDAFYVLAYAAAALGAEPLTGPALARALPRLLPPGAPIDVGPAGIYRAFSLLGSGKGIDLGGTTTTLDFDPETGDPTADFAVSCLAPGRDVTPGALPEPVDSGLLFRARTKKLEGTLRCP